MSGRLSSDRETPPEDSTKQTQPSSIEALIKDAVSLSVRNPSMAMFLLETVARQKKAAADRERLEAEGVRVPPIMIASVTNRCNLSCKGCYNRAQHRPVGLEMAAADWSVFREARDLGISIVLLAGGEPRAYPPGAGCSSTVREMPLKDALRSRLLQTIRQDDSRLARTKGGCALWENRDWVRSLLGPGA